MPEQALVIRRLLGRNGIDPPQDLPDDMAAEVLNLDFYDGSLGRKRSGAAAVTLNGFTAGNTVDHLFRYLPSDDETAAELHAIEGGALTTGQRLAAGTTWATYTLANAIQANPTDVSMVNFAGKLYQAYNSSVNRIHVYPSAGGTHRVVGLATPATPANPTEAAGAVTDTRKYAVCWTRQENSVTVLRSNLSDTNATAATLSSEQATITRPALAGEGETHWELYAFSIVDNYSLGYRIATTAVGTTTAADNNATLDPASMLPPPTDGANTPPPSAKYLLTDGTHLIGLGAWETAAGTSITPSPRLVWWTPAIGTTDTDGDTERISNTTDIKSYLYVDEGLTGGGGPLMGSLYLFAFRKVWKLVPTGEAASAYQRITLRTDIGCIRHQTICMGEDEEGRPALYWLSHIGPFRAGGGGIQYLGRDLEDRAMNLGATGVVGWSLYVPERHQVWFYVATGSSNNPNERWVFDCRLGRVTEISNVRTMRYGWSRHTGTATEARHGCMFANTLGASMSRDLKPYVGRCGTGITDPTIWKSDTGTQDGSSNYQGLITTKAYTILPGHYASMRSDAYLLAETSSGVTITLSTIRDFGAETVGTATALLTAAGSETRALLKFEGAAASEASYLHWTVGDASAANTSFVLDQLTVPLTRDDRK